jgi:hypothetical protein
VRGILFLCVANSARSQMAEGLARAELPAPDPASDDPNRSPEESLRAFRATRDTIRSKIRELLVAEH